MFGKLKGGSWWDTGILHTPYKQRWVPLPEADPPFDEMFGRIRLFGVEGGLQAISVDPYRAHHRTCDHLMQMFERLPGGALTACGGSVLLISRAA